MGWVIAGVVVVAVGALVWWSSGRAKPFGSRRGVYDDPDTAQAQASSRTRGTPGAGPIS